MKTDLENEFIEIDLLKYMMILRDRWKIIIAIFCLIIVVAGAYIFFIVNSVYQVEAGLFRSEPNYKTNLNIKIFNLEEYKMIFQSGELAKEVINELGLADKYNMEMLLDSIKIDIGATTKNQETGQMINITYKTKNPKQGEEIINKWINLFVERISNLFRNKIVNAQNNIIQQYQSYKVKFDNIQDEYYQFQNNNQIQLLENEINNREKKIITYKSRLLDIESQISQKAALIAEINRILEGEKEIYELNESFFDNPLLLELKYKAGSGELKREKMNPIYLDLKRRLNNNQADLEKIKAEKGTLNNNLSKLTKEVKGLKSKLSKQKRKFKSLKLELNTIEKEYNVLYEKKEKINTALEIQSSGLELVNRPVEPQTPISPNKKLILIAAAFLGLFLGVLAAFLLDLISQIEREKIKV